jgi:DNA-binding response OmpR family regulator
VILADDDEAITSNLAPFLERSGFTVHVAPDGEAAAGLIERLDPDACVLDVLMPRADGREVLRRLRAAGRWLVHVQRRSSRWRTSNQRVFAGCG